jgi:hypothetical protein
MYVGGSCSFLIHLGINCANSRAAGQSRDPDGRGVLARQHYYLPDRDSLIGHVLQDDISECVVIESCLALGRDRSALATSREVHLPQASPLSKHDAKSEPAGNLDAARGP